MTQRVWLLSKTQINIFEVLIQRHPDLYSLRRFDAHPKELMQPWMSGCFNLQKQSLFWSSRLEPQIQLFLTKFNLISYHLRASESSPRIH